MNTIAVNRKIPFLLLFNIAAVSLIYMVPAISHALSFPLYLFEPMRLVLILALVHTNKQNAYILAATLPFVSFLISGHPLLFKAFLISGELVLNVALFFTFLRFFQARFTAILASIVVSKMIYYLGKYLLIHFALLETSLISTALWIQVGTMLLFSIYVAFFFRGKA
ncbi:MAG TPA: hypothetical protein VJ939_09875 [Bacteroidales bacterium]|nr:hypothetical protein [Bacteroidales bacterium]